MTNTLKATFISATVLAISAVPGFAQSSERVSVTVPFGFTAGSSTLPAGRYNFTGDASGVMFISSLDTRKSIAVLTNAGTNRGEGLPALKFDRINGVYNLTEVDMADATGARVLRADTTTGRPASLGSRAATSSTGKSLTK